jgi:hypothetical protein
LRDGATTCGLAPFQGCAHLSPVVRLGPHARLAVFVAFPAMGMALPVVPRHVHDTLSQGTAIVRAVIDRQYVSCFMGRLRADQISDGRAARPRRPSNGAVNELTA